MRFAVNGANFIYDNATATQAMNSSRNDGNSKFQNTAYTVSTTAISGTPAIRSESMLPTSKYSLEMYPDYNYYSNIAVDSVTALEAGIKRTNQIPNGGKNYKVRYRCMNHVNFSVPVARITSAAKTGTTTCTIVTDVPHGLTTSDFIQIQGVRDIANFPNLVAATAVASIISPTSFTVIQGGAITASSQDGVVFKINGTCTIANGTATRAIQSIQATGNELSIVLSGTILTTLLVGDTFNVYGLAPALQSVYEGAYVVLDNSASTIIARPINTDGSVRTIADIGSTPTGGMYIRRVDYIIHWTRVKEVSRQSVEIANGDTISDVSRSTKVSVVNTPAVTMTSTTLTGGQTAHSTAATGAPLRIGSKVAPATPDLTLVAGDAADVLVDDTDCVLIRPYGPSSYSWSLAQASGGIINTTDVVAKTAAGASIRNYVTGIQLQNVNAVATEFVIKDGATVMWRCYLPANMITPIDVEFAVPLRGTANTAVNIACITTDAQVYANVQGTIGF